MKRIFYLGIIYFTIITSVQTVSAQNFSLGVKAGADMKKLTGITFNDEFSFGYHAGVFAQIKLAKWIGIQPEVYFSEVKMDTTAAFNDIYQLTQVPDIKLQYINIPLLINLYPVKNLAVQVGPQYGIALNNQISLLQNGEDAFNKGDFSMVAGLQYRISSFRIYGRYQIGLSNLNEIDSQDKWKSQTIHLGIGFALL